MSASVTETSNAKVWTDRAFMALPDDECRATQVLYMAIFPLF